MNLSDIEKLGSRIDRLLEMSHYLNREAVKCAFLFDKLFPQKEDDYVNDSVYKDSVSG